MIYSMTGFGRSDIAYKDSKIKVEIRSLNSKKTDIRIRMPETYKSKEMVMHKILRDTLLRGKITLNLEMDDGDPGKISRIDRNLFNAYAGELKELAEENGLDTSSILTSIMVVPEVIVEESKEIEEAQWEATEQCIEKAIENIKEFRASEGKAMQDDLKQRAVAILNRLDNIESLIEERSDNLKAKLKRHMKEFLEEDEYNKSRYEQELLYYLERYDINEEIVRLRQHCDFFLDILMQKKDEKGRKLNFVSQEMGREINTIGAKANYSGIQHIVVSMKEELDKIKEQTANVL